MVEKTGAFILEKGEQALMGRAWLAQHAQESIDIQYFIWSNDNIGILAAEMLLTSIFSTSSGVTTTSAFLLRKCCSGRRIVV